MSSNTVIREVSNLLVGLLTTGLTTNTSPNPTVDLANPADETADKDLSIWLYQVMPNPYLRNTPNLRTAGDDERFPPLALELCYLMTPLQRNEAQNQGTLGRALQVLYDNSIMQLNAGADVEELHISICQRSIQELAEVWEALQKPYRLSVCFEVRSVNIDSERVLKAGRVRERATELRENPQEAEV
jgi:hypothetical protein